MTDIEKKALALVNEVAGEAHGLPTYTALVRSQDTRLEALCRAIEQHEAFRQEVSDAVMEWADRWEGAGSSHLHFGCLFGRFIIAKPDPLVEVCREIGLAPYRPDELRAAIEKRGGKIVWGEG